VKLWIYWKKKDVLAMLKQAVLKECWEYKVEATFMEFQEILTKNSLFLEVLQVEKELMLLQGLLFLEYAQILLDQ
jgi:hypothetical protein